MPSSSARTPKLQVAAEQPSTGKCWISPKKDAPCPRAKEKPQQDGRKGKIAFRIKPHTRQRRSESSHKTLCTPGPRDPTDTKPDLPVSARVSPAEAWISSGCHRNRGSGCSRPGRHHVWHKSSWRRWPLAPP